MPRLTFRDVSALAILLVLSSAVVALSLAGAVPWAVAVLGLLGGGVSLLVVLAVRQSRSDLSRATKAADGKLAGLATAMKEIESDNHRVWHTQQLTTAAVEELGPLVRSLKVRMDTLADSIPVAITRGEEEFSAVRKANAETQRLLRSTDWAVRKLHPDLLTDLQAMHQLFAEFSPRGPLPAVGGWALNPVGLLTLVDLIERHGVEKVVECGSGTSTLWIALALQARGSGKVVSLDHERRFADAARWMLDLHGLTEWAEVRHAPLVDTATPRGTFQWYDVDPSTIGSGIDLLIVDGPPSTIGRLARYPALPVLAPYLSPSALVLADDTSRPDEVEMLEYWRAEEPRLSELPVLGSGSTVLALTPPSGS